MSLAAQGFPGGATALARGAGMIARSPALWPCVLAPVGIALAAFGVVAWKSLGLARGLAERWVGTGPGAVHGAAVVLAQVLGVILAAVVVQVAVFPLVAGPFSTALSEGIEARVTGRRPAGSLGETVRDIVPGIWRGLVRSLYGLAVLVIFAPVLLLPAVGALLYLIPTAYIGALGALDVTFERRRMDLAAKRGWMRARRAATLGLGAAILLGNLIPLGALLVAPAAVAGGTLLVVGDGA